VNRMAKYIGNIPSVGEFKKLDSLTSTFNGSLTQFDLEYGSTSVSVGDASQLIVSLNGIIQEPLTAYTLAVGGSAIVFSSAPASTDTCHIILLGGVGGTSTVSDGAVTAAKLDAGLKDYLEETYTANGSQTTYALTRAPIGTNDLMITIDGIVQPSTAYSIAGTTLTISPALPNGTDVRVVHMGVRAGFVVPSSSSITAAMFQDFTTDVKFNDNAKAVFGTDNDLQIYHDGSHSYISDQGTGNIKYRAASRHQFENADGSKLYMQHVGDIVGQEYVQLRYNNATKLATTATGIDVTGSVTSDGLTVDGDAIIQDATPTLEFKDTDNNLIASIAGASGSLLLKADTGGGTSGESMQFHTGGTERMRIDSSGNVLVGKSSSSGYTTGIELRPYGLLTASRDSAAAVLVNRTTTEGAIISLAKDGAAVGSIGNNTDFYIASQDGCGLRFTNNQVLPCSESGATQTTSRDLGSSGARFRDLYTSGGVYLGGTGAANKLDDYEEGSWTPSMSGMGNASFSQQFGSYTKIGNLAHVTGKIAWSGATGTASVNITGIPFTGADASDHLLRNSAWPQGDYVNINTLIDRNGHFRIDTNVLFGVIDNTSGSTIAMQCGTHVASSGEFNFYLVYRTT
jgi:hypothetical protein